MCSSSDWRTGGLEDWRTGGQADWVHFDITMETKDRKPSVILVTVIKIDIDT